MDDIKKPLSGRGGPGRGQGRKPGSRSAGPIRNVVKQVRWSSDEWEKVEEKATGAELTPSEYIRKRVLEDKFAVWAFGFYACAEKEDQVNRMEARHAQQMMESCR
jgi:hypothetical protein